MLSTKTWYVTSFSASRGSWPVTCFVTCWQGVEQSFGWTIVLYTAFIKLLFFPLQQGQLKSASMMQLLSPKVKEIQEKYKEPVGNCEWIILNPIHVPSTSSIIMEFLPKFNSSLRRMIQTHNSAFWLSCTLWWMWIRQGLRFWETMQQFFVQLGKIHQGNLMHFHF